MFNINASSNFSKSSAGSSYELHQQPEFLEPHVCFLTKIKPIQEPTTYQQGVNHIEWQDAIKEELKALETNQTWDIVDLPYGKKPIGCKWIYKVKLNSDGSIDRYKARVVANGYTQIAGIDYFDSFSPAVKVVTVRLFLIVAASKGWPVEQMDINNAFLHGHLKEEIYIKPPDGYTVPFNKVCRLKKSLYGLKQASREWNSELTSHLIL